MGIPVKDYPDYLVFRDGRIWSNKTNKFLKPGKNRGGYESVDLFNANGHRRFLVHRLVAEAFIPNPRLLPQVNHKDENPSNNTVGNLEWCDAKYNMNYGNGAKNRHAKIDYSNPCYKRNAVLNGKKVSIPVAMIADGEVLKCFESAKEASRKTGVALSCILRVVHGERHTAGGYVWKRTEVTA